MKITIHGFVAAEVSRWPMLQGLGGQLPVAALAAAAFREPITSTVIHEGTWGLGQPATARDGHLELSWAGVEHGGILRAWVRLLSTQGLLTAEVTGAAYGISPGAFWDGVGDFTPAPNPILCAAAAEGSTRWIRRSWVWRDTDGTPRRRELFIRRGRLLRHTRGGCWLERGELAAARERLDMFEPVGLGARRVGDAPVGLGLVPARPGTWKLAGDGGLRVERTVLLITAQRDRPRGRRQRELDEVAAADRYARRAYCT
jgi:hypothetical protein